MKHKLFFLFILGLPFLSLCNAQKTNFKNFTITGTFKNDFSGYLYFDYDNKTDSCLVINNQFVIKGSLIKDVVPLFFRYKQKSSMMSDSFYLENKNIEIELAVEQKKIKDFEIANFLVTSVKGTQTSILQNEYNQFVKQHQVNINYHQELYDKLNSMVDKHPKNIYLGDLIESLSFDEKINKEELKKIYTKLDKKSQDENSLKHIENNLYPERELKFGSPVFNFELPNQKDFLFNTSTLKGKWFLIDFWSSWCTPCREQLPALKEIYNLYKNRNFEIIGVSLDKSKSNWIKALDKENLEWINVIENNEFLGKVAKKYSVFAIPSNFLINPSGKIVAKNILPEDLKKILKENL